MGSEYPDVLGDLVDARRRYEVNGVHYLLELIPPTVAPGGVTRLRTWLQSCWDVPVEVSITVRPESTAAEHLSLIQERTDVPLAAAEVGQVDIPIACSAQAEPGDYPLTVTIGVHYEVRGLYIRGQKSEGQMGQSLLNFTTGMSLASVLGLGFVAHTRPEQDLLLKVEGEPETGPVPDLTPTFVSHWTVDELPLCGKALQYVNDQKLYLLPQLTRKDLYLAFLEESRERFKDAQVPLEIGEAIFLAKILTFAVEYLLGKPEWQDAILVPAYRLAYRFNLPMGDPVFLVARADYARITRLACSLSFGMLRRRLGRDPWTMEEQLAVTDLIADRVERGGPLPVEFLYLPLILGGLEVAHKVQMPGEDPAQSIALLARARQKRRAVLAEIPELDDLLDRLLRPGPRRPEG